MSGDPISENAKATQELAKASGKAIDAGREIGGFLNRVFGEAIEHSVALFWTNRVREKRIAAAIYSWQRLEELLHKTERALRRKGVVNFRIPPPKIILPLLENATVEEDDHLQTLWAELLTSAMDSNEEEVERKFVSILSDLNVDDAYVLEDLWKEWFATDKKKETRDSTLKYGPGVDGTYKHDEINIVSLNRLGLIAPAYTKIKTFEPGGSNRYGDFGSTQDEVMIYGDLSSVTFTSLGEAFCRAVIPVLKPVESNSK